jgi:hypothetical protein
MAEALRVHARNAAKRGSRLVTVPTAELRPLPDFLIIGAQRGGTTSLYRYLCSHPEVAPAVLNKGIHYFDTNYGKSPRWYRSHFPTSMSRALRCRRAGVGKSLTGEGSPYYIFHPLAPERIAQLLPEVPSILLLRDPIKRAYSHYQHEVARGFESLSFEEALEHEEERIAGEEDRMRREPSYVSFEHQHHTYLSRGLYLSQIRRWHEHFSPERLLIIDSADLFRDTDSTYGRVLAFLGLVPRSLPRYKQLNAHGYSGMSNRARSFLEHRLETPNRELEDYLGRSMHWSDGRR